MRHVICANNVYGDPVPLVDSETDEIVTYATKNEADVECARLNEYTEGGYYVCRMYGAGALERIAA